MKIEIPDDIAQKAGLNHQQMKEFLAVALYKKGLITGVQGGRILSIPEIAFHGLLAKYNECVNYDIEDLMEDLNNLTD